MRQDKLKGQITIIDKTEGFTLMRNNFELTNPDYKFVLMYRDNKEDHAIGLVDKMDAEDAIKYFYETKYDNKMIRRKTKKFVLLRLENP